jgi:peptidoglycan/LPS O-acetylase OafA/YrhL
MSSLRKNNVDLVRLICALQIMFLHTGFHLKIQGQSAFIATIYRFLFLIPGIPILFAVSGYFIAMTYSRKPILKPYMRNRFLRMYPGLWACLAFTCISMTVFGFINLENIQKPQFWGWLLGQLTVGHFYTPSFFKGFSVGNPNGSLWTIFVEVQFYILVPLVWYFAKNLRRFWYITTVMAIIGIVSSYYMPATGTMMHKFASITIIPYFPFFWIGITLYVFADKVAPFIEGKGLWWLSAYIAFIIYFGFLHRDYHFSYFPDMFSRVGMAFWAVACFSCAFTARHLTDKWLKGADFSYGIYIYHMPLVGIVLEAGLPLTYTTFWGVIVGTILLAVASWFLVEKAALSRKIPAPATK